MNEISPTFCVLPWTHLATYTDGSVLLCCVAQNDLKLNLNDTTLAEAWNSKALKEARLKMLKGEKVSSCSHCYREEKAGCRSHRIAENKAWADRFTKEWLQERVQATAEDGSLKEGLVAIDLRLGNTCNLTCVMCRPQDSSRWVALGKKLESSLQSPTLKGEWIYKGRIDHSKFDWYKDPEFWEDVRSLLPHMRELIIGGGEPMLLEEHKSLIEECVRSGHASHIHIRYHTNGTILDPQIFELWKHFKLVEVFVSLDGFGEMNHYMRYPAPWPTIEKNLKLLDSYPHGNLQSMLLCSVHLMSFFYLDKFSQWIENQKFRIINHNYTGYFHPGIVHYPPHLSAQVLPTAAKKLITERMLAFESKSQKPSTKIEGLINFMNEADRTDLLPLTREYIEKLDEARGTSMAKVMPELYDFLFREKKRSKLSHFFSSFGFSKAKREPSVEISK